MERFTNKVSTAAPRNDKDAADAILAGFDKNMVLETNQQLGKSPEFRNSNKETKPVSYYYQVIIRRLKMKNVAIAFTTSLALLGLLSFIGINIDLGSYIAGHLACFLIFLALIYFKEGK